MLDYDLEFYSNASALIIPPPEIEYSVDERLEIKNYVETGGGLLLITDHLIWSGYSNKLLELFEWSEQEFLKNTEGSAIRRIGYERWQRNIAIALGNAPYSTEIVSALKNKLTESTPIVAEHIQWALKEVKS